MDWIPLVLLLEALKISVYVHAVNVNSEETGNAAELMNNIRDIAERLNGLRHQQFNSRIGKLAQKNIVTVIPLVEQLAVKMNISFNYILALLDHCVHNVVDDSSLSMVGDCSKATYLIVSAAKRKQSMSEGEKKLRKHVLSIRDRIEHNYGIHLLLNDTIKADRKKSRLIAQEFIKDYETAAKMMNRLPNSHNFALKRLKFRATQKELAMASIQTNMLYLKTALFEQDPDFANFYDMFKETKRLNTELSRLIPLNGNLTLSLSTADTTLKKFRIIYNMFYGMLNLDYPTEFKKRYKKLIGNFSRKEDLKESVKLIHDAQINIQQTFNKIYWNHIDGHNMILEDYPFHPGNISHAEKKIMKLNDRLIYLLSYDVDTRRVVSEGKYLLNKISKLLKEVSIIYKWDHPLTIYSERVQSLAEHIEKRRDFARALALIDSAMFQIDRKQYTKKHTRPAVDNYLNLFYFIKRSTGGMISNVQYQLLSNAFSEQDSTFFVNVFELQQNVMMVQSAASDFAMNYFVHGFSNFTDAVLEVQEHWMDYKPGQTAVEDEFKIMQRDMKKLILAIAAFISKNKRVVY